MFEMKIKIYAFFAQKIELLVMLVIQKFYAYTFSHIHLNPNIISIELTNMQKYLKYMK
jgi:hypothetical protein